MPEKDEREQQILSAAATVIARLGYDKTTMGDIAAEAAVSRRTVYLYFKGKDELFEALLSQEWMHYSRTWLEAIEADPQGGTLGGFYRALNRAVNSRPLISAVMRRDRRVVGNYLRKTDSLAARMASGLDTSDFVRALQSAGAVRQDIDAAVLAHILEILSYGQLTIGEFRPPDQFPPYDTIVDALANLLDRALLPEGASNSDAGKAFFRQLATTARAQLEQVTQRGEEHQPQNRERSAADANA